MKYFRRVLKPVTAVWRWPEDRAAPKQLLISPRREGRLSSAEDVMEAGDRDAGRKEEKMKTEITSGSGCIDSEGRMLVPNVRKRSVGTVWFGKSFGIC